MKFLGLFFILTATLNTALYAQEIELRVFIRDAQSNQAVSEARLYSQQSKQSFYSNSKGLIQIKTRLPDSLFVFAYGYESARMQLKEPQTTFEIILKPLEERLEELVVRAQGANQRNISALGQVEGVQINAARKTERIKVQEVTFNRSVNNARQIFAKVAGLNVWESDRSGGQLNIGARGLSPNRTSNFNVRQNGYDIAADALGYPESYYTPPMEAIERIDVIRGASSLQYGPQFGGLLNFVFKRANAEKPFFASQNNTVGSFGLVHNFTELGLYKGNWDIYAFYHYRAGDEWRPNGRFDIHTAQFSARYRPSDQSQLQVEYTLLRNLSQQPGGLTDVVFERNPRTSVRERNWFKVRWNLLNLDFTHRFNASNRFNSRFFGHYSSREALGNLERITVADMGQNRTLLVDDYANWGNETRFIKTFELPAGLSTFLIGTRYYSGNTHRRQGDGSNGADADFRFLNPNNLENSDYDFPSRNFAAFTEWILPLTNNLSITPGIRYEYILTQAKGFYRQRVLDFAGNVRVDNIIPESMDRSRSILLFGLGLSYEWNGRLESYANFSRNYRAITFSDLRIANPNFVVDSSISDESGYNLDLGIRGDVGQAIYLDVNVFYLRYNDRIGLILRTDEPTFPGEVREIGLPPFFTPYRYRTNVADSRTIGLEALIQLDWNRWLSWERDFRLSTFINASLQDGRYIGSQNSAIQNRQVELVSPITFRAGLEGTYQRLSFSLIHAYTHEHFSDATNVRRSATAVNGIIPSYQVTDFTLSYQRDHWGIEAGIQNLFDNRYFTRRAEGYPGPGIIPADPRNYFMRLSLKW